MERDSAVGFVRELFDYLNRRDYQRASRYFAEDVTLTGAEPSVLEGREAVIDHFRHSDAALGDSSLEIMDVLIGESKVGVRFNLTGTHIGSFDMGAGRGIVAPTGTRLALPVFWALTIEGGRITDVVHYWDMFRVLTELGLIPPDR